LSILLPPEVLLLVLLVSALTKVGVEPSKPFRVVSSARKTGENHASTQNCDEMKL